MDRFEAMATFLAVIDAGSISAASRKLRTPVATVSRRISDLETHLQVRLFTRASRHLALTDAGRSFSFACRRIVNDVEEAERAASGEYTALRGSLVLSAPIALGRLHLLPVVTQFLQQHPDIDVRLEMSDQRVNLVDDRIDVAIRVGELVDSSLIAQKVGIVRRVVCASPSYLEQRGTPEHPSELIAHHCITFENTISSHQWRFSIGRTEKAFSVHSRLVANTAEAAVDAAVAGLGLARSMDYQIDTQRRAGALALVLEHFSPPPSPVHLIYRNDQSLPMKTRAFLNFATPHLKRALRMIGS